MQYKEVRVDSLLKRITTKDNLFGGNYTVDPYQNCEFGCLYCDSSIDKTIYVKTNAAELLEKEIKKIPKGVIIVGSVHDPYQEAEKKFGITRRLLEIIKQNGFSCHVLTKSDLVLRDMDVLTGIKNCKVTLSIVSTKNSVSRIFEKKVPSPEKRLQTINKLSDSGITTGLAIIPVLPFIVEEEFEDIAISAKKHEVRYLLHKHLELKGDQKNVFMDLLKKFKPDLENKYEKLYGESYMPDDAYILKLNQTFDRLCRIYKIKNSILDVSDI